MPTNNGECNELPADGGPPLTLSSHVPEVHGSVIRLPNVTPSSL